jgi:hypothetical protein
VSMLQKPARDVSMDGHFAAYRRYPGRLRGVRFEASAVVAETFPRKLVGLKLLTMAAKLVVLGRRVGQSLASLAPDADAQRAGSTDSAVMRLVKIVVTGTRAVGFARLTHLHFRLALPSLCLACGTESGTALLGCPVPYFLVYVHVSLSPCE